jgi:very-short-patch-repair endonuclease
MQFTEEHKRKLKESYNKRIARGEVFGFQKGHEKFRGEVTEEEKIRRTKTFKKNYIPKSKPSCEVCGKELWKWKDKRCREHMDYSFRKGMNVGHFSSLKGKKLNLSEAQKIRRSEIARNRVMPESAKLKISAWHIAHPNRIYRDTSIELAIQDELANRKILFIKQFSIPSVAIVDFFLPEFNIVIQCDGCYWHNCLEHYPNHHTSQRSKDSTQNLKLETRGIKVYRFWEHDIKVSPKDCIDLLEIN